jgi:chitinase
MCGNPPGGYFDFAQLPRPGTQEITDEACVASYCVGGDGGFVSYDSPQSVQIKAQWAKTMGLAGLFFWHALSDAKGTRSLVYNSYVALHS